MRVITVGVAVCLGLSLLATTGCGGTGDEHTNVYSARDVREAFTEQGLPLRSSGRLAGGLLLVAKSTGAHQFSALVLPEVPQGGINLTAAAAMQVVPLRNIVVSFDPLASVAVKVKAAISSLRQRP